MPELPEVETTRKGIKPYLERAVITQVTIRNYSLRWPIPSDLAKTLNQQTIQSVKRRAKYLLIQCNTGTLLIHLGMSGSLRILNKVERDNPAKHDHVDISLDNGYLLRYTDPRRFGAVLWTNELVKDHKLIAHLGPEPLLKDFHADYLYQQAKTRHCSVKTFIMNGPVVVGVGNIYANESLFLSGIHPRTIAQNLTETQCENLVEQIKLVLGRAIKAGGTTLKDFTKSDGKPGYFSQQLNVYGRKDQPCFHCGHKIEHYKVTQRATYYCPVCQVETN
jgi:formamidopyrimidine-DNA glycosylase